MRGLNDHLYARATPPIIVIISLNINYVINSDKKFHSNSVAHQH